MKKFNDPSTWFKSSRQSNRQAPPAPQPGAKVFVENDGPNREYFDEPSLDPRITALLDGYYGTQNFIELFYCLPEVFAPIHEIASRVADAKWELVKSFGDQEKDDRVDYKDENFNRLFSQPNFLESHKQLVYNSVVYEILTGKVFWHINTASILGNTYREILNWWNLPANRIRVNTNKSADIYSATELTDIIKDYRLPIGDGRERVFAPDTVMPIVHTDISKGYDLNCAIPLIKGAEKAIKNLIPVYEARGVIYIKRGALGWMVNRAKDANGPFLVTEEDKKAMVQEHMDTYGVTGNKLPFAISKHDMDFVRTGMSIQELQPFDETVADAVSIYAVLRVPRHLVPTKDNSTFANADADLKSFYQDVIIPWAERYAQVWTNGMRLQEFRRFIRPNYSHVDILQENKAEKATADKANGETWFQRWKAGACSLNEWIASFDGIVGTGSIYEKKILELTPEEQQQVLTIIKGQPIQDENTSPEGSGTQKKGATDKLKVA